MKIIEVPEELIVRAKQVLYLEEAIKTIIRELTKEIVKNHFEVVALWNDVQQEAAKQGIVKQEDEVFNFDYITSKFLVIKKEF